MFKKVVIIGTGLIGGSLGLALKDRSLAGEITGTSRSRENSTLAKEMGAIDIAAFTLDVVDDADLVVLAGPVDVIIDSGRKIAKLIKRDCVVIDVASVKRQVLKSWTVFALILWDATPWLGRRKAGWLSPVRTFSTILSAWSRRQGIQTGRRCGRLSCFGQNLE